MVNNIIKILETKIGKKELELEDILKIVSDPEIEKELTAFFKNKEGLTKEEINKISSNSNVEEVLDFFALQQNDKTENYDDTLVDLAKDPMYYYSKYANSIPLYTREEEKKAFERLNNSKSLEEKKEIRNEIAEHNLRLVLKVANIYFKRSGYNSFTIYEDCVQFGNVGLMTAIDKFETDKEFRFSTMATWWIYQSISRGMMDTGRAIRVPIYLYKIERRIAKEKEKYFCRTGKEKVFNKEEIDSLAAEYGVSKETIELALNKNIPISLENKLLINSEEDIEYKDLVQDNNPLVEDTIIKKDMIEQVRNLVKTSGLDERSQRIIIRRYGLYDTTPQVRNVIGEDEGITRERVRQIENKSLERLAISAKKRGLDI